MSHIFDDETKSGEGKSLFVKGFERNKLFKERVMELKDGPEKVRALFSCVGSPLPSPPLFLMSLPSLVAVDQDLHRD